MNLISQTSVFVGGKPGKVSCLSWLHNQFLLVGHEIYIVVAKTGEDDKMLNVLHPRTDTHGQPPLDSLERGPWQVLKSIGNWKIRTGIKQRGQKQKQRNALYKYNTWWYRWDVGLPLGWVAVSVVDPDDYKLYEWLFPWFCASVQWEQWPHCNPWLFTFLQISSYWNHGEGRAGVKEDSHTPYLY